MSHHTPVTRSWAFPTGERADPSGKHLLEPKVSERSGDTSACPDLGPDLGPPCALKRSANTSAQAGRGKDTRATEVQGEAAGLSLDDGQVWVRCGHHQVSGPEAPVLAVYPTATPAGGRNRTGPSPGAPRPAPDDSTKQASQSYPEDRNQTATEPAGPRGTGHVCVQRRRRRRVR